MTANVVLIHSVAVPLSRRNVTQHSTSACPSKRTAGVRARRAVLRLRSSPDTMTRFAILAQAALTARAASVDLMACSAVPPPPARARA